MRYKAFEIQSAMLPAELELVLKTESWLNEADDISSLINMLFQTNRLIRDLVLITVVEKS